MCIVATLCILFLSNTEVFAQKTDSIRITLRGKATVKPQTQTVPVYRAPSTFVSFGSVNAPAKTATKAPEKNLKVTKVFPNPVTDQVNINLRLEKESMLTIRITDILGNEVVILSNEKAAAGDQTKNFTLPKRLNTGMYYLRIIAGQESIIKKISVL